MGTPCERLARRNPVRCRCMVKPLRAAMGKVSSRISGKTVTTCARIRYDAGYSGQRFVLSADGVIRRRPVAVRMARFRPTQGSRRRCQYIGSGCSGIAPMMRRLRKAGAMPSITTERPHWQETSTSRSKVAALPNLLNGSSRCALLAFIGCAPYRSAARIPVPVASPTAV
jgi:hypothetical protein